jgi:hypothetical protein
MMTVERNLVKEAGNLDDLKKDMRALQLETCAGMRWIAGKGGDGTAYMLLKILEHQANCDSCGGIDRATRTLNAQRNADLARAAGSPLKEE